MKKVTIVVVVAFFVAIELEKKTMTQCNRLLLFKRKEESDGSSWVMPSPFSSLQHYHKKTTVCCRHLLFLFKHNKEGDGSLSPFLLQQK